MEHTQGEWKEVGAFVISEMGNRYTTSKTDICSTSNVNDLPLREQIANARLIAAAPDLLAACEMALQEWYPSLDGCSAPDCLVCARHEKEKEQVEAAITKAKQ